MKIFKQIQFMLMLSGAAAIFLNFSNPKIAHESIKALKAPLSPQKLDRAAAVERAGCPKIDETDPRIDERYVKIEGKLYPFSARGVYNVNGVSMMYKNGEPKTLRQIRTEEISACLAKAKIRYEEAPSTGSDTRSALSVYTPGGVQKVLNDAQAAAAKMEQRNRILNQLAQ